MLAIGLAIALVLRSNASKELNHSYHSYHSTGTEIGFEKVSYDVSIWLNDALGKELYPLFVLQSYVIQSSLQHQQTAQTTQSNIMKLSYEISNAPQRQSSGEYRHSRDVDGICNKLEYVVPFQSMTLPYANTLFMELWPKSVSCLRSPYEDYTLSRSGDDGDDEERRLFEFSFLSKSPTLDPTGLGLGKSSTLPSDTPTKRPTRNTTQTKNAVPVTGTAPVPAPSITWEDTKNPTPTTIKNTPIISSEGQVIIEAASQHQQILNQYPLTLNNASIVGDDYASNPTTSPLIQQIYNCPYEKSIMNGPYILNNMAAGKKNNYTNVFMASTPIPPAFLHNDNVTNVNVRRRLDNENQTKDDWGIATILIDWDRFVIQSDMHNVFSQHNLQFTLRDQVSFHFPHIKP